MTNTLILLIAEVSGTNRKYARNLLKNNTFHFRRKSHRYYVSIFAEDRPLAVRLPLERNGGAV